MPLSELFTGKEKRCEIMGIHLRDVSAAIAVWRAVWRARKRRVDFAMSEVLVMEKDGTVAFGLFFGDDARIDSCEVARARWAQSGHVTKVLTTGSLEWALFATRRGPSPTRFKHRWPQLTSTWCQSQAEVKSRSLKKRLDAAAKQLVNVVEMGARRRVEMIETLWAIDGRNLPRFERAVAVKFNPPKKQKLPVEECFSCPGGFCDWKQSSTTSLEQSTIARNAVGAACREARTGEALDFWPESLVLWCLRKAPRERDKSGPTPCSTSWTLPKLGVSFPCKSYNTFRPLQTIRICWVWRGPAARFVNVDLIIVLPDDGEATDLNIGDELLLTERLVASSVSDSYFDWEIPVDVNGTCSSVVAWQLRVTETEPIASGYPLAVALSDVFRIDKSFIPRKVKGKPCPPPPLRALVKAKSAELVAKTTRQSIIDERQVKRWDQIKVCSVCAQVYAELARHRETWLLEKHHHTKHNHALNQKQAESCYRLAKGSLRKEELLTTAHDTLVRQTKKWDLDDTKSTKLPPPERPAPTFVRQTQQRAACTQKEDGRSPRKKLPEPPPSPLWGAALIDDEGDEDEEQPAMKKEEEETPLEVLHEATARKSRRRRRRRRQRGRVGFSSLSKLDSYQSFLSEQMTKSDGEPSRERVKLPEITRR